MCLISIFTGIYFQYSDMRGIVFLRNGIDFPYPTINEVGQVKRDTFTFNNTNSNLDVVFGSGPIAVAYDVDAFTNPFGDTGLKGFITDKSFYRVQVQ